VLLCLKCVLLYMDEQCGLELRTAVDTQHQQW
jgi:hypothetical protein